MTRNKWVLVGLSVVGFWGIILLVIIISAMSGGDEEHLPSPEVQPTRNHEIDNVPTPTPISTPTLQPTPTPTVLVCPTIEESFYFLAMADFTGNIGTHSIALGELFTEASANPLLMVNDDWLLQAAIHLAALDTNAEGMLDVHAPSSVSHIHGQAMQAARSVQRAVPKYTAGIDNFDDNLLLQASHEITTAAEYMNVMGEMAENFC